VSNIVPGGSMQVNGSNFPPDSTVDITVDGSPVAVHSTNVFASIDGIMLRGRQTRPADHIVAVKSNGTFETTVPVPSSWTPGSHHTIQATTQNAQVSTQASVDVETQSPRQTSVVASDATPTDVPTISPTATPTDVPTVPPTATPASVIRTLKSQVQTQSQMVNATGPGTTQETQATGTLTFRNPYSGSSRGIDMTYDAGTVFDDDTGNSPNVQ